MNKLKIIKIIVTVLLFLFFSTLFFLRTYKIDKYITSYLQEYPMISLIKTYNGIVSNIYNAYIQGLRNNPNSIHITLDDSIKLTITTGHEIITGYNLEDVLIIGSRIYKEEFDDTLHVLNNEDKDSIMYRFILKDMSDYVNRYIK
jgi:hypothetical protein